MIISLNWLKQFTDITLPIDTLTTLIGARLVEIETVESLGEKYKDVVIVKVVECSEIEDSDHLHVTRIDDGGAVKDVERGDDGLIQVVCGAPNVRAGMFSAWLPPKSIVPETFESDEPVVLQARNLRGLTSNGMLASAKELGLFDDHSGIFEIPESKPGLSFIKAYQLDDYLLDIENKSLTHRPDTFGVIGFAREVAGIQGLVFKTPDWLHKTSLESKTDTSIENLTVTIDDPSLADRYQAIVLGDIKKADETGPLMPTLLARSGVRPISSIVDITNYLMLVSGQPLHAFDYDKLTALNGGKADIHVRVGRGEGDTLKLLDGRTVILSSEDIVIANGDKPIALAGAMGGADTEIDENTKNIIIESATFNLYNLRGTQMRHGIFSEAITRFTKGQPAELTAPVLVEAVRLLGEWTDAKPISDVVEAYPGKKELVKLTVKTSVINAVLGSSLTTDEIVKTLTNVEFMVELNGDSLSITVPYWRADIHIPEDIIEEVGRLNGFDTIELTLPTRDFTAVMPLKLDQFKTRLRKLLVCAGSNEVLTYSFIHGDLLSKAGQSPDDSYRIINAISPDLQFYRQSLTPSLLNLIHPNIKQGYSPFALFELNKTHPKQLGLNEENVPTEVDMVAFVFASKSPDTGASFYQAKHFLGYVMHSLGIACDYQPIETQTDSLMQPFEARHSAVVIEKATGRLIGIVGEYKKSVARSFKLPDYCAGFELNVDALYAAYQATTINYLPLSRFPSIERDICFQTDVTVTYGQLINEIQAALDKTKLRSQVVPIDIYQADGSTTKNTTIRITLNSDEKTLTSQEAASVIDDMIRSVSATIDVTVI